MTLKKLSTLVLGTLLSCSFSHSALAYPDKPVRLIVPYAPGGSADIIARLVSEEWGKQLGKPLIVENRSGSGGNIGVNLVAKAQPDGYTIGLQTVSLAINPALYKTMPYDTLTELEPIGTVATSQHVLVVNNEMPAQNIEELIQVTKNEPGKYIYGSAGSGSTFHMAAELFKNISETNIVHIPYRGGGPALMDTIGGHVNMSFPVLSAALPQVQGGKLRALGVTGPTRSSLMPDTPTIAEAGLPDYSFETWFMVIAPTGTPESIIQTLNATLNQTLQHEPTKERMVREAFDPAPSSPSEADNLLRADLEKWQKIIEQSGIEVE